MIERGLPKSRATLR